MSYCRLSRPLCRELLYFAMIMLEPQVLFMLGCDSSVTVGCETSAEWLPVFCRTDSTSESMALSRRHHSDRPSYTGPNGYMDLCHCRGL